MTAKARETTKKGTCCHKFPNALGDRNDVIILFESQQVVWSLPQQAVGSNIPCWLTTDGKYCYKYL